jgi:4-hydroxy-3-polyprenylbenzoate decarboxylase
MTPDRLVIGISGASGAIYGIRMLEVLRNSGIESHLVISKSAGIAMKEETGRSVSEVKALASVSYLADDIGAGIASGSFRTRGMIIAPCSVKTLGEIANGITPTLLPRAADVVLKERRRLVLMVRETPLHLGHLRNMCAVTEMGAIVAPPVPGFYSGASTIEELVDQTVGRVLDLFDIDLGLVKRWKEV